MFSGIIESTAKVQNVQQKNDCRRVAIRMPRGWKLKLGQSISIDGICSTVVEKNAKHFAVEYMPTTLAKTIASQFEKNAIVNVERSLTLQSYIDGHVVQGHVDTVGRVVSILETGNSREIVFSLPVELMRYIALHGSVAVNGVSLTVSRFARASFTVSLIPFTLTHTNLGLLKVGDKVNIEVDMIARYLLNAQDRDTVAHAKKRTQQKTKRS